MEKIYCPMSATKNREHPEQVECKDCGAFNHPHHAEVPTKQHRDFDNKLADLAKANLQ